jgi:phenylacetate-coenzyme A ligase PaaK-like adenylate-forming protein
MGLVRTIFYCLRLRRHDKFSPEQIQAFQRDQLRRMVRFAKEKSPFFAEYYADVDPDAPGFSVRDLPPTTKEMLMEHFDRVVTDPRLDRAGASEWIRALDRVGRWYKGRFVVTTTSGTTGSPGMFAYDRRDWDWVQAFAVTRGIRFKPSFFQFFYYAFRILVNKVRVALVSVLNGHFITHVLFRLTPRISSLVSRFSFLSVVEPVPSLVEQLNRIRPNVLHCYPTMLEVLAHEQLEGRLRIAPWVITCSSEPLTRSARDSIAKAFPKSPLFETYGTSEGVNLASECTRHEGLHLNSDYFVLEPVRLDGSPCEAGQAGDKLYLTCLFARTMPILRYEISDQTTPLAGRCECGLPYPLISVEGRTDDTLWVDDDHGEAVALPPIPFEALFLNVDGLVQYQLVQPERDRLLIRFRLRAGTDEDQVCQELRQRFVEYLRQKGVGPHLQLAIERVDEIRRDPISGKVRQIVSLVERPYLPGRPLGDRRTGRERRLAEGQADDADRRQQPRRADDAPGEGFE